MNTLRNIVLILLLMLGAWVVPMSAMTPGPTLIRECPACKKPVREFTIGSGNLFGAKSWTDGKLDAPMLPLRPTLVKCPHCQKLFWMEDSKKLAELGLGESDNRWQNIPDADDPEEKDYIAAANAPRLSREHEKDARLRAWWLANDMVREHAGKSIAWSGARLENLEKLFALLQDKDPSEALLKAEIARELGRFDACVKLLDGIPVDAEAKSCGDLLKSLAQQKQSKVKLWVGEPNPPKQTKPAGAKAKAKSHSPTTK